MSPLRGAIRVLIARGSGLRGVHASVLAQRGGIRFVVTHSREGLQSITRAVLAFCVLLVVGGLICGCTAGSLSQAEQQSLAEAAAAPTRLEPGDKIRITVFGEDKLSGDYQLDQSGRVSLPLAGTVEARGLTQTELEEALARKFRSEYLKNPKVTVTITTVRPFYIVGEVEKPGEYPYKSGLNVLTAIATAGGPTYRASRSTVQIQRHGETGMREYPVSVTVPILPGDVIRIPERYF